jgi:hypothetical protein
MVDKEARAELRIALRRLVTGRMTNDDFDDVYTKYCSSADEAVASIVCFGWSLYSDSSTYRLKGVDALSPELRSWASRAILFLYTDQKFRWPSFDYVSEWTILAALGRLGGLVAIALGLIGIFGLAMLDPVVLSLTVAPAVFLGVLWLASRHWEQNARRHHALRMECLGDYDCWPFLQRTDLETAKKEVQFFGPACPTHA